MTPINIEPARFGMTGRGIGAPFRFSHMDELTGGPLDAPFYIPMGGMRASRLDPGYVATSVPRPGVFDVRVPT